MMLLGIILIFSALSFGVSINYAAKRMINKLLDSLQQELESYKAAHGEYPASLEMLPGYAKLNKPAFTYQFARTASGYTLAFVSPKSGNNPRQRYERSNSI